MCNNSTILAYMCSHPLSLNKRIVDFLKWKGRPCGGGGGGEHTFFQYIYIYIIYTMCLFAGVCFRMCIDLLGFIVNRTLWRSDACPTHQPWFEVMQVAMTLLSEIQHLGLKVGRLGLFNKKHPFWLAFNITFVQNIFPFFGCFATSLLFSPQNKPPGLESRFLSLCDRLVFGFSGSPWSVFNIASLAQRSRSRWSLRMIVITGKHNLPLFFWSSLLEADFGPDSVCVRICVIFPCWF